MNYSKVFDLLGVENNAKLCFEEKLDVPVFFIEQGMGGAGFLPAMTPIWREDIDFIGYWNHWFCQSRDITIVQTMPEMDFKVKEIARNFSQLIYLTLYRKVGILDSLNSSDIDKAKLLGIDLLELKKTNNINNDDINSLIDENIFKNDPLLEMNSDKYKGDFKLNNITAENIRNICSVEVDTETKNKIIEMDGCPEWFLVKDQANTFYKLLDSNDFSGAWMSLNSNGWEFSDAKNAIMKLANKSYDTKFLEFAQYWCSLSHEEYGGY